MNSGKISINLNPQKQSDSIQALQNISIYSPIVILAIVIFLALILILQLFILGKAYTYGGHKKKWENWEEKYNLMEKIKAEKALLENEKSELRALAAPKYDTARLLENIYLALPKNVWFEDLEFKDDSISINGYAVRWQKDYMVSLEGFINSLRKKDYFASKFNKVNIGRSQKADYNGVEILKFVIECKK